MRVYFEGPFSDPEYFFTFVETIRLKASPDNQEVMTKIRQWLEQHGEGAVYIYTRRAGAIFKFENADDATLFKLAWGGV